MRPDFVLFLHAQWGGGGKLDQARAKKKRVRPLPDGKKGCGYGRPLSSSLGGGGVTEFPLGAGIA